jgi:hypothetical protein
MSDITNQIAPFGGIAYINGLALQIAYPNATGAYRIYNGMNGLLPEVESALRSAIGQAGINAIDIRRTAPAIPPTSPYFAQNGLPFARWGNNATVDAANAVRSQYGMFVRITVTVHSIPPGFRAAPCGCENAARAPLDRSEEAWIPERPADAFGTPQAVDRRGVGLLRQKSREVGIPLAYRRSRGDPIVAVVALGAHARPAPVAGTPDKAGAHRVERDVAQRRRQMILVHHHAPETPCQKWPVRLRRA